MRRHALAVMVTLVVLAQVPRALASPWYGPTCAACHPGRATVTVTVTGNDATADPTEGCAHPDLGTLKVFTVTQGTTKSLTATLSGVSFVWAAVMKGMETTGIQSCGTFAYTGDATWTSLSGPPLYFTKSSPGTSLTFNLTVGATTPPDFYDLVFATAGLDAIDRFYAESHFYVQVVAPVAAPTITLNKTMMAASASQGSSPASDSFTVANSGGGTLNYTIASSATWLTVSPTSSSSTGPANTVAVYYSTTSLTAGSYPATITITDPAATNNPQTINATLTIGAAAQPTIALNTASLAPSTAQGSSPANDTFTVGTSGAATLNYTIGSSATWLTVSPTSGSSTGPANTITVQYDTAVMTTGSYGATITVTDPTATNNPQTINVTLTIGAAPKPTIALSKSTLTASVTQGSNHADDTFTVANSGQVTLNYTVTSNATWLTVSPAGGSTTGPANPIAVHYSTSSLAAGSYQAAITVTDPNATNSPQTISVSVTVIGVDTAGVASILLNKLNLTPFATQGSVPFDDTFTVADGAQGVLNYTITSSAAWLTVLPASGTSNGTANTHIVHYDSASLMPGTYNASLAVTDANASNNPQVVHVTLTVGLPPLPTITVSTLTLVATAEKGSVPADATFTVANSGLGMLHYSITSNDSSVTISPDTGSSTGAANTHTVHYDTGSLGVGTRVVTITVNDATATNTPQVITVTLTVTESPSVPVGNGGDGGGTDADSSVADGGTGEDSGDEDTSGSAVPTPIAGACGAASASMIPAVLLGLTGLRSFRRSGRGSR